MNIIDSLKHTMGYTEHPVLARCASCRFGDFEDANPDGACSLNGAVNFTVCRDAKCDFFEET